jgi:S1-C subfamily serine protease
MTFRNAILAILLSGLATGVLAQDKVSASVAKIENLKRSINIANPWRKSTPTKSRGTGFLIGPRRILTNAHVVNQSTEITVQFGDGAKRLEGKVIGISQGLDLALVEIEADPTIESLVPLTLSSVLPPPKAKVQVYGYPVGGDAVSITEGIVSRIEFVDLEPQLQGLRIQVDAAMNAGNSGGPAIVNGEVVGVNRAKLGTAENIGYLVPSEEVGWFLKDIEDGNYDGKPQLFQRSQSLENEGLRKRLGIPEKETGILLRQFPADDPEYPLKVNDVLTHIGRYDVSNTGRVKVGGDLQLPCQYLISKLAVNDRLDVTILREGQRLQVNVPLLRKTPALIDRLGERSPSYFVYGPLILVEATGEFMGTVDNMLLSADTKARQGALAMRLQLETRRSPLLMRRFDRKRFADEQLVMVPSPLLPHRISRGLTAPTNAVVAKINGIAIRNLRQAVEILRDAKSEFIEIEFADIGTEVLVFDREKLVAAMPEIMEENGILNPGSPDLMPLWK